MIDKSGSMSGLKLEMSKAAARAAVDMLGPNDQIGVIAFDSAAEDVVRLQTIGDRPSRVQAMINRLGSGGGTNMEPGVRRGYEALRRVNASIKHMIVLTDGQTEGTGYATLAARMRRENITTSTVAVGTDAAKTLLVDIAGRGGGKYYQAINPRVLPRIFTRETRRVVRPLVFEDANGLRVTRNDDHEILAGLTDKLPPITGFVLTSIKENPLVEVPLSAERPGHPNNAVLAAWNYGLGRTVAFTTDAGQRWARNWSAEEDYDKLFVQMIRWSMRSITDRGEFTVSTDRKDGQLTVVVQALTEEGEFLNNLSLQGGLVRDDGTGEAELPFSQVGPGRYCAEVPLAEAGSYLLSIFPGRGYGALRSGVSVPYSPEFRDTAANEGLLLTMAAMQPAGGQHGEVIRLPDNPGTWSRFLGPNLFRRDLPPGRSFTDVWPATLLIAASIFLLDVFNRRVSIPWNALQGILMQWGRSPAGNSGAVAARSFEACQSAKLLLGSIRKHGLNQ
ncbi:MAG: VWA domain-containing protein [Thermomicrobiales bacterium]